MQRNFVNIKGVPINICTWGRWISEKPNTSEPEDIIVMIPGNPGVIGFYDVFLKTLHEERNWPVWAIGHTGHEEPKDSSHPLLNDPDNYGLRAQIEHKANFIKQYVPENARLHLVGHSIGTYMVLELLKDAEIKRRVVKSYLLFPVFERISETSNGKHFLNVRKNIIWLFILLTRLFIALPEILSSFLIHTYMSYNKIPTWHKKSIIDVLQPEVLRRIYYVAFQEIEAIKARNDVIIKDNQGRLQILYGDNDNWVPLQFVDEFKKDHPDINVETTSLDHAFVFDSSVEVANIVCNWMEKAS